MHKLANARNQEHNLPLSHNPQKSLSRKSHSRHKRNPRKSHFQRKRNRLPSHSQPKRLKQTSRTVMIKVRINNSSNSQNNRKRPTHQIQVEIGYALLCYLCYSIQRTCFFEVHPRVYRYKPLVHPTIAIAHCSSNISHQGVVATCCDVISVRRANRCDML